MRILGVLFVCFSMWAGQSHQPKKLFYTKHQSLYKKNILKHITEINTIPDKLVGVAENLKKKFPLKKDQLLLNYYIKHQKPKVKLFYQKDHIDVVVNGRSRALIKGINGDTNTLFMNGYLIDMDEPKLVVSMEKIEKAISKRKNAWSPMDLIIPKAHGIPSAMLALAIYLSTQSMPGAAKANQPSDKPKDICRDKGGDPHRYLKARQSQYGEEFGNSRYHYDAFDVFFDGRYKPTDKSNCQGLYHEVYSEFKEEWKIESDRKRRVLEICEYAWEAKKLCNQTQQDSQPGATPSTTSGGSQPVDPTSTSY